MDCVNLAEAGTFRTDLTETPESVDLSVCIVNWNCCGYLQALLKSIELHRDGMPVEVIVVDNASSDNSAKMVEAEFPQVRLLRNDCHEGLAKANNQAAAKARGRLLLFLNNDTVIRPVALTTLVDFLDQHPEICAVGPSLMGPDGKRQGNVRKTLHFPALLHRVLFLRWTRLFRSADRDHRQVNFDLSRSAYVEQIVGAAVLVRRQEFMRAGGWDEAFEFGMDDIDLSSRLSQLGNMYYLAEAQVTHWGGIATKLDQAFVYRCSEYSYVRYIRKHFSPRAARIYKLLITADMPLRVMVLALRCLFQKLLRNRQKSTAIYDKLSAASQFLLRGLPRYWLS
jgi:N-acetylglucosaminyl-diphospho-decaprenol L-rhamnosyltransferase